MGGYAGLTVVLHGADPVTLQVFADDLADALAGGSLRPRAVGGVPRRRRGRVLPPAPPPLPREGASSSELRDTLAARIAWERAHGRGQARGRRGRPTWRRCSARSPGDRRDLLAPLPERLHARRGAGAAPRREADDPRAHRADDAAQPTTTGARCASIALVRAAVARLDPKAYAPGLEVAYAGAVTSSILEHDALAEDLVWATALVLLAVALSRSRSTTAPGRPSSRSGSRSSPGRSSPSAIAEAVVGNLNSNTAFLGSIVVGNGINVGLILFARYLEERRQRDGPAARHGDRGARDLARDAHRGPRRRRRLRLARSPPTSAASTSSASSAALGMALAWIFSYVMTPPLVLAWERRSPIPTAGQRAARPALHPRRVAPRRARAARHGVGGRRRSPSSRVFFVGAVRARSVRVRLQQAPQRGRPRGGRRRLVGRARGRALRRPRLAHRGRSRRTRRRPARSPARIEAHRRAHPEGTLGQVLSIATFVPEGRRRSSPSSGRSARSPRPRTSPSCRRTSGSPSQKVLPPADLRPFGAADLPETVRRRLTHLDGQVGTPVLVHQAGHGGRLGRARGAALRAGDALIELPEDVPVASMLLLLADVLHTIARDGPRATLPVARRRGRPRASSRSGSASARSARSPTRRGCSPRSRVGVLWFGGLAGALDLKLNMLNFIALPITFGIGVDYATNIFQRRRLDHARSIADVVRTTGGAVALCSLTTIIGYSSLLVARNQALISFGVLADLGELACLAAALFALPAVLRLRELAKARAAEEARPSATASSRSPRRQARQAPTRSSAHSSCSREKGFSRNAAAAGRSRVAGSPLIAMIGHRGEARRPLDARDEVVAGHARRVEVREDRRRARPARRAAPTPPRRRARRPRGSPPARGARGSRPASPGRPRRGGSVRMTVPPRASTWQRRREEAASGPRGARPPPTPGGPGGGERGPWRAR